MAHRPLHILAQGDGWVVVAKPPRMLTHRGPETRNAAAAVQSVRSMLDTSVFPIHRLDRGASGCLLFATRQELAGPLSEALAGARKTYLAFVRGFFKPDGEVVVETPMKDDLGVVKEARSVVQVLGRCHDPRSSLLRVRPETGRYHQVRRHVRDLNHPIIGDGEHGDTRVNRWWREEKQVSRLGLHCLSLDVPWREPISVVCPLFTDQARVYRTLPWWEDACGAEPALRLDPLPMRIMKPRQSTQTS